MSTLTMAQPVTSVKTQRIVSIDLLRGAVIIVMALDHIRDYYHSSAFIYNPTDLDHTSAPIFFTRWITHFCAPVFMLLAGTSAYLYGNKRTPKELSFFLFTRGWWLIFLDFTVLDFGWFFDIHFYIVDFSVIWALGTCMLFLSLLVHLPKRWILFIGLLLIGGHNLLDNVHVPGENMPSFLWAIVHERRTFNYGRLFIVAYPIVPWIGVMACGYCLGSLYEPGYNGSKRRRTLRTWGLTLIALFVILRAFTKYGDPNPWSIQRSTIFSLLAFLNTAKYPPSLLFLLMTLGPALVLLAFAERPLNLFTRKIAVFGRVPMFYYIIHIYLIHLLAFIGASISGHKWSDMILTTWVTSSPQLKGYGFSLLVVYVIWISLIIILYPLCKWYDSYKRTHLADQPLLSYF